MYLMKKSKSKRLSDTAVIHTKRITDPVVTHGDRVVQAAGKLAEAIGAFAGKKKNDADMADLQKLMDATQSLAERNKATASAAAPPAVLPDSLPATRVQNVGEMPTTRVPVWSRGQLRG